MVPNREGGRTLLLKKKPEQLVTNLPLGNATPELKIKEKTPQLKTTTPLAKQFFQKRYSKEFGFWH